MNNQFFFISFVLFLCHFGYSQQSVIITEIMRNPSAVTDANGEWFELYNPQDTPVDINGWTISDNGSNSRTIDNAGPLMIPSKGYIVLGPNTNTATNGGVEVAYDYGSSSTFALGNTDDEIIIKDANGNLIDSVAWDNGTHWPKPEGASMALTNVELDNNTAENWHISSTTYGDGDAGTPGKENNVDLITSFEKTKTQKLIFYPNPVKAKTNVSSTSNIHKIVLTDVNGVIVAVWNQISGPKKEIDLSSVKKGIYFIKVITEKSIHYAPIVKQ